MVTKAHQGIADPVPGSGASLLASERGKSARVGIDAILVDADTNPRHRLRNVDELAGSIRTYGLLQPLVVREVGRHGGQYRLVAGHRRLAALQLLAERYPHEDWGTVQVIVRPESEDDAYLLTLVENLQRQDLPPLGKSLRAWRNWCVSVNGALAAWPRPSAGRNHSSRGGSACMKTASSAAWCSASACPCQLQRSC